MAVSVEGNLLHIRPLFFQSLVVPGDHARVFLYRLHVAIEFHRKDEGEEVNDEVHAESDEQACILDKRLDVIHISVVPGVGCREQKVARWPMAPGRESGVEGGGRRGEVGGWRMGGEYEGERREDEDRERRTEGTRGEMRRGTKREDRGGIKVQQQGSNPMVTTTKRLLCTDGRCE